ncbi:MAG: hypothetical protein ACQERD_00770 [Campylobacterota bacterium]
MNSTLIVVSIVILLLLVVILVLIKYVISDSKQETKKTIKRKENIDINSVTLPSKIESFDTSTLIKACQTVYETFVLLDFKNNPDEMNKIEWHAWQVAMLIKLVKKDCSFIVRKKDVFPESIYSLKWSEIEKELDRVIRKYHDNVDFNKSKDELCNQMLLSGRDISIIFYYVINRESNN